MTATVVKLPTAATSFYTVRKARDAWAVVLVTPCLDEAITTPLCTFPVRPLAVAFGQMMAARLNRPFKEWGRP